ncbi:ACT domain-containing protein [Aliiroseovarius crassostreae]|uniref:ACT domain-containing protein n=1 Tax=Aliiroseovarius crassostreae TaxID=154981 RepID=UPI0022071875|nr:ACT domain-containing protein [Aliiroseovarius crassostreae]UWP88395.1 ACT domain-containing protein [Aliiroseovarius crassostreae]
MSLNSPSPTSASPGTPGETDLATLLASLSPRLDGETYVFATLKGTCPAGVSPRMSFQEAEGVTLILTQAEARAAGLGHVFPCRMISLEVHSSLEAVGLIARIASELAALGMGVNPVSGFYHDHLFVPEHRAEEAMALLQDLARTAADSQTKTPA